jgi:hypothetical protein
MSHTFNKKLVDTCIEYFKRVHNVEISIDTANEYLHSFASLYLAFNRPNGESPRGRHLSAARDSAVAETGSNSLGVSNT